MGSLRINKAEKNIHNQKTMQIIHLWEEGNSIKEIADDMELQKEDIFITLLSHCLQTDKQPKEKSKNIVQIDDYSFVSEDVVIVYGRCYDDNRKCEVTFDDGTRQCFNIPFTEVCKKLGQTNIKNEK